MHIEKANKTFWDMGQESYKSLFVDVSKMNSLSLILPQIVCEERKKYRALIEGIVWKIREGIVQMINIEEICSAIEEYKKQINENKNFIKTIKVPKASDIDLISSE